MKADMFDVLMYLFETHGRSERDGRHVSEEHLFAELEDIGFDTLSINRAFDWLEGLVELQIAEDNSHENLATCHGIRVFSDLECFQLSVEARSALLQYEQVGILNTITREQVINRLMSVQGVEIGPDQVRWIVIMVLLNQPTNRELALSAFEDLMRGTADEDGFH